MRFRADNGKFKLLFVKNVKDECNKFIDIEC